MPDGSEWIARNAGALRAAEASTAQMEDKINEVNRRFTADPQFHARVYMAAKYLAECVLPPEREREDRDGRWHDALMSAIAVAAVFEKLDQEPATVLYDPDKATRTPILDTMSKVRDFMKMTGRNQAAFVTANGSHILVHRSPGDGFGYGVVDPESNVQRARLSKETRWPLTPLTSATEPLSERITRALGTDDWLILHDGHHLVTADELDGKA